MWNFNYRRWNYPEFMGIRRIASSFVVLTAIISLSACSKSETSPSSSDTNATQTPSGNGQSSSGQTPSGQGSGTNSAGQEVPQTAVSGSIIDTPKEILDAANNTVLTDNYQPAIEGESVVLEAVVPKIDVFAGPMSTTPVMKLDGILPSKAPLTFLVDGQTSTRYKVLLPIRPNGSTGWVEPSQVKKYAHKYRVVIELTSRKLTAYNGDTLILSEPIAVGKGTTPTPSGRYYIKELLRPCYDRKQSDGTTKCVVDPNGAYGPYAYGLSGFSPVLTDFNGGEGVLGIHGTNEPESIGRNVSHGCIRMRNEAITSLAKVLPLGTPVIVKA